MVKIADRIIVDPDICVGKPVIEGTRIPIYMAVSYTHLTLPTICSV